MLRPHTCGELRLSDLNKEVALSGWVQKVKDLGGLTFIDLRDRYGITQLAFNADSSEEVLNAIKTLGREFVIQVKGTVIERESKNKNNPTGDIAIKVSVLKVLKGSQTPPFTIEDLSLIHILILLFLGARVGHTGLRFAPVFLGRKRQCPKTN